MPDPIRFAEETGQNRLSHHPVVISQMGDLNEA